jgi:organic hydroperoxide reductase OsmC/OhrA
VAIRAKHFEYWVSLGDDGDVSTDGEPIQLGEDVTAEHLLLAGLARCSMQSLAYFARLQNVEVKASAYASGTVTRRAEDDRYGFTEIECRMDVELDGDLDDDALRTLRESAEWGCFVGASLNPPPRYTWRVNGRDL